ncbi:MAG: hypothetical protein KDB21_05110, partial [Acidimicrobiales bacterium]|nr:hypothetical protein [Acidimicrobiales bacterium]
YADQSEYVMLAVDDGDQVWSMARDSQDLYGIGGDALVGAEVDDSGEFRLVVLDPSSGETQALDVLSRGRVALDPTGDRAAAVTRVADVDELVVLDRSTGDQQVHTLPQDRGVAYEHLELVGRWALISRSDIEHESALPPLLVDLDSPDAEPVVLDQLCGIATFQLGSDPT